MTIFHAIKFSDAFSSFEQLKTLPVEVLSAWHNRLIDYAVEQAKSCVHLDVTGNAQQCIDAIAEFRAGKITQDDFVKIADSVAVEGGYTVSSAGQAADSATHFHLGPTGAWRGAFYARWELGMNPDWNQVRNEHGILFKKWLVEELMMFDMEMP